MRVLLGREEGVLGQWPGLRIKGEGGACKNDSN